MKFYSTRQAQTPLKQGAATPMPPDSKHRTASRQFRERLWSFAARDLREREVKWLVPSKVTNPWPAAQCRWDGPGEHLLRSASCTRPADTARTNMQPAEPSRDQKCLERKQDAVNLGWIHFTVSQTFIFTVESLTLAARGSSFEAYRAASPHPIAYSIWFVFWIKSWSWECLP